MSIQSLLILYEIVPEKHIEVAKGESESNGRYD